MPYHHRNAYRTVECYGGMTRTELGADFPPKAASFLRAEEIEAVTAYVIRHLQGQGEPTYEDCIAFWGATSRMRRATLSVQLRDCDHSIRVRRTQVLRRPELAASDRNRGGPRGPAPKACRPRAQSANT